MKILFATILALALTVVGCGDCITNVNVLPAPADTSFVPAPPDTIPCPKKDKCKKKGKHCEHQYKYGFGEPDVIQTSMLDTPVVFAGVTPGVDPGDDMPSFSPWYGIGGWKAVILATEELIAGFFN